MKRGWRQHREAKAELSAAAHWYEEQRLGLGERFMDAVEGTVAVIRDPAYGWGFYR